ncbi:carbon-nitrogen hydrolase [bacterium]|nr:carbon-nitrogen hydrolase [bacterium]
MTSSTVTLGLVQMNCSANPEENLNKAIINIEKLADAGSQIIALQELFGSLYFCQENKDDYFKLASPIPGKVSDALSLVAKKKNIVLVASLYENDNNQYYNTAVIFDADGTLKTKYRKLHIPDDLKNHYSELYYFKPGNLPLQATQTKYGKIGVLVCWDQWYPEPARALAADGAQIIFYPTAIGWPRKEREQAIGKAEFEAWVTMQRSHAIANGVFVAAINRVGHEDNLNFWGGSFVSGPFGVIQQQLGHDEEANLMVKIDLNESDTVKKDWPFLNCRRFKLNSPGVFKDS